MLSQQVLALMRDVAVTLENERKFVDAYKHLLSYRSRASQRRTAIAQAIKLHCGHVDPQQVHNIYIEHIRRYFDDTMDGAPAFHTTLNNAKDYSDVQTVDFFNEVIRQYDPVRDRSGAAIGAATPQRSARADDPKSAAAKPQPVSEPQPKEPTMKHIEITTKTLVNGQDIANMEDAAIYDLIAQQEAHVESLNAIKNKPVRLQREIEKCEAGIQALVKFLDDKDTKGAKAPAATE